MAQVAPMVSLDLLRTDTPAPRDLRRGHWGRLPLVHRRCLDGGVEKSACRAERERRLRRSPHRCACRVAVCPLRDRDTLRAPANGGDYAALERGVCVQSCMRAPVSEPRQGCSEACKATSEHPGSDLVAGTSGAFGQWNRASAVIPPPLYRGGVPLARALDECGTAAAALPGLPVGSLILLSRGRPRRQVRGSDEQRADRRCLDGDDGVGARRP